MPSEEVAQHLQTATGDDRTAEHMATETLAQRQKPDRGSDCQGNSRVILCAGFLCMEAVGILNLALGVITGRHGISELIRR